MGNGDEQDDPVNEVYESWFGCMEEATDVECLRLGKPNSNDAENCPCASCRLAKFWSQMDGLEQGMLFCGMVKAGFEWRKEFIVKPAPGEEA